MMNSLVVITCISILIYLGISFYLKVKASKRLGELIPKVENAIKNNQVIVRIDNFAASLDGETLRAIFDDDEDGNLVDAPKPNFELVKNNSDKKDEE